ncbi:MAG: P1 family peptidase [Gemmatimonadota bacterium]
MTRRGTALALGMALLLPAAAAGQEERPRVRDSGIVVGALPPGPANAITDVPGVKVGHATVIEGDSIRSGVTVIVPHAGNVFLQKVPAALHVANGFGKLAGVTQIRELGTIETPIALTNTLAVGRVVDGLVRWTLDHTTIDARSVNAVVGETNDGFLNAITVPRVGADEVYAALAAAGGGPVAEGSVGAGTGTMALGFKGGIGTASRRVRIGDAVYTLGVLVQSNFGGALEIAGVQVGRALGKADFLDEWMPAEGDSSSEWRPGDQPDAGGGSIMIVVATDAPLDAHALERIARRAPYAIGRIGGFSSHGSGDYVIAFSSHPGVRVPHEAQRLLAAREVLRGEALNPLFLAVIEATEEAILNSLFRATTVTGWRGTAEALPLERVREILARSGFPRPMGAKPEETP